MDIRAIQDAIRELEESDTTFENVQELAALYIVKENLLPTIDAKVNEQDIVESELDDILPRYKYYVNLKRKYQMHEATKELLIISMQDVCKEIKDLVFTLYNNTDTADERKLIKDLIFTLHNEF